MRTTHQKAHAKIYRYASGNVCNSTVSPTFLSVSSPLISHLHEWTRGLSLPSVRVATPVTRSQRRAVIRDIALQNLPEVPKLTFPISSVSQAARFSTSPVHSRLRRPRQRLRVIRSHRRRTGPCRDRAFRRDINEPPDLATLDDYTDMPVSEAGVAGLRGTG